jgi:hypothetical protein
MDIIQSIKLQALSKPLGILKCEDQEKLKNLIGKTIIKLSDHKISPEEENIVQLGLTFCPSPGSPDYSEIWTDFKEFYRRLEVKKDFQENPTEELLELEIQFKNKLSWRPPFQIMVKFHFHDF